MALELNSSIAEMLPVTVKSALAKMSAQDQSMFQEEFEKKRKGFKTNNDSILVGVETKTSSAIRIERDENFESNIKGLYPIGEGSGYSGGIISSALDGLKFSLKFMEN